MGVSFKKGGKRKKRTLRPDGGGKNQKTLWGSIEAEEKRSFLVEKRRIEWNCGGGGKGGVALK